DAGTHEFAAMRQRGGDVIGDEAEVACIPAREKPQRGPGAAAGEPAPEQYRLIHRCHPLWRNARAELLHALGVVDLGREEIALGIDRKVVHPVELTGLATGAAEGGEHRAVLAQESADLVVLAVGIE